ncbi:AAA family ATPase [Gorillibacterium sp. sgz500922]|uniref:AAA family ATPase n=1 Tax=Gorillibacterium sp. sgz500922 TaxID=3446694 RepID=UPI003F66D3E4
MATIKITLICEDQRLTHQLVQQLTFLDYPLAETIEKPKEAYLQIDSKEPRVILFVEPEESGFAIQSIQQLRKVNESAPVVFLSRRTDFRLVRDLYRAGAMEVLHIPDELGELERVLERAQQVQRSQQVKADKLRSSTVGGAGTVLTLMSGKGGSGTTFISANLAQALALKSSMKVLFIDLNLQFGGIQSMFNITHDRNLGDLKSVIRELTESQIRNVLYRMEDSGLSILLSPSNPQEAETFTGEDIELLLAACRQFFDLIVLDVSKELNDISVNAISNSDYLIYVVNLERPAIMKMQNILQLLDRYHLMKEENIGLIVNRYSKKHDLSLEELGKMCKLPVIGKVGDDYKRLQRYFNLGLPLITDGNANAKRIKGPAKDLQLLAAAVLDRMGGEPDAHIS